MIAAITRGPANQPHARNGFKYAGH